MIHKWLPYLFLIFTLVFVDAKTLERVNLNVARLELFLKSLPLRLKLMWDIYWIKRSHKKYLDMARKIQEELNETD